MSPITSAKEAGTEPRPKPPRSRLDKSIPSSLLILVAIWTVVVIATPVESIVLAPLAPLATLLLLSLTGRPPRFPWFQSAHTTLQRVLVAVLLLAFTILASMLAPFVGYLTAAAASAAAYALPRRGTAWASVLAVGILGAVENYRVLSANFTLTPGLLVAPVFVCVFLIVMHRASRANH